MKIENLIFWLAGIHYQESKNGSISELVSGIIELFKKAKLSIQIVSGGFSSRYYCNEGVISVLNQAIKNNCSVEVIVGPDANDKCLNIWTSLGVPIYVLNNRPKRHFAVIDGKHVRVEDPHKPGHEKQVQYLIYDYKNVEKLNNKFEELKSQAKLLENS